MKNELSIFERRGQLYTDSREVAAIIPKPHNDLMKSIRKYCKHLTAGHYSLSDYFVPSTYTDSSGRSLPCYHLTRKGCDMVAHKLTGEKGVWFTATYIDRFYAYEQALRERQYPMWRLARSEGKKVRRLETDAIKMFVSYAGAHGSKNPEMYYKHFTMLAYQVTEVKVGGRDASETGSLMDLRFIEGVIDRAILNEIASGAEYHQAFQNIKAKVLQVSALALMMPGLTA